MSTHGEIGAHSHGAKAPRGSRLSGTEQARTLEVSRGAHVAPAFHTVAETMTKCSHDVCKSETNDRTIASLRLTLFEPDPTAGGGFLVIEENTSCSTIEFRRHELDILKVLNDALAEDRDRPPDVRGWRRIGKITEIVSRNRGYTCDKATISRYLHNIRTAIRKETGKTDIAWLEEKRRFGLRLTVPIATTVLSQ